MESEAGYGHHIEYYKAQSVISRTYALHNLRKHESEGFNLCDQVHCQAYKGSKKFEPNLMLAAEQTTGIVIVDDSLKFITATYHSNCGGQTASSEQVWNKALPYLRSVKDPFCSSQPNAFWKREISKNEWINYLAKNKFPIHDSLCISNCTTFTQNYRNTYLSSCNRSLHLRTIRESLNLKSTYFSIEPLNDNTLVLKGRGFGHGVGLCQEGAMKMAVLGYDYKAILKHYFTGIYVLDIQSLNRLAEEK
jgi:stage II sporulation protein D